jgi:alcohol dehydrogenase (cytochrome c)
VNATPVAYNPKTGLIYTSSWDLPRIVRFEAPKEFVLGNRWTHTAPTKRHVPKEGDIVGHHIAMDPISGRKKWSIPLTKASSSGMLATDGGLIFTGNLEGKFLAMDADTGKVLYEFQTGSAINATPITYTYKGRQYVSIASGLGGNSARAMVGDTVPTGGSMWTFALMPD